MTQHYTTRRLDAMPVLKSLETLLSWEVLSAVERRSVATACANAGRRRYGGQSQRIRIKHKKPRRH
jgi:hypothetical protein